MPFKLVQERKVRYGGGNWKQKTSSRVCSVLPPCVASDNPLSLSEPGFPHVEMMALPCRPHRTMVDLRYMTHVNVLCQVQSIPEPEINGLYAFVKVVACLFA